MRLHIIGAGLCLALSACGNNNSAPSVDTAPGDVSPLSDAEYRALSSTQRYAVTNTLLASLYQGTSVLEFFSVTGDLSQRDLLSLPPFPTVHHQGLLPPTVIAVDVDQRGRVFQISLTGSSGSATADQQALDLVGAMVFAPAAGYSPSRNNRDFEHLRRARVMIHWWTLPPPATPASTNPPAATPSLQPLPLP